MKVRILTLAVAVLTASLAQAQTAQQPHDAGSGVTTGRRAHQDVKVHKTVDSATPKTTATPNPNVETAHVKSHSNTNNN
jgi:type VI protein secretion system component Hcp